MVRNWTTLSEFSRVESLCISHVFRVNLDFLMIINRMRNLTKLHIEGVDDLEIPGIKEALSELTKLKSLGFFQRCLCRSKASLPDSMQHLTGLTNLVTNFICSMASIRHLTNLAILRISIPYGTALYECPLLSLKLLEELDVSIFSGMEDKIFSGLPRLKKLCIRTVIEKKRTDSFTVLGRLTQLSSLSFTGDFEYMELPLEYCLQFNLLTGLRSLSFCVKTKTPKRLPDTLDFLTEGSYPLLRHLHLEGFPLSPDDECEVMRRFPCLNSLEHVCKRTRKKTRV